MKIIFLDFDGVLNSHQYLRSPDFKNAVKDMTDAELYLTKYEYMLDPEAIKLVNDLVTRSGAEVIASTSHRVRYSLDEMSDMLKNRGATFQIAAKTPRGMPKKFSQTVDRGDEIQEYLSLLEEAGEKVEGFVILDDMFNMLHLTKHLVRTSQLTGLTPEDIERAVKILNGDFQ
jgi:hypothetical protein